MLSFREAQRILAVLDDALDKLALTNLLTDDAIDNTAKLQENGAAPSSHRTFGSMRQMRTRFQFSRVCGPVIFQSTHEMLGSTLGSTASRIADVID